MVLSDPTPLKETNSEAIPSSSVNMSEFPNKSIDRQITVVSTLATLGLFVSARLYFGVPLKDLSAAALPYKQISSLSLFDDESGGHDEDIGGSDYEIGDDDAEIGGSDDKIGDDSNGDRRRRRWDRRTVMRSEDGDDEIAGCDYEIDGERTHVRGLQRREGCICPFKIILMFRLGRFLLRLVLTCYV